jgi:chromosome segregation ATPase
LNSFSVVADKRKVILTFADLSAKESFFYIFRSSPSSRTSFGMTKSQINDLEKHQHEYLDIINKNSSKSIDLNTLSVNTDNEILTVNYYEQKYKNDIQVFQEQLQLHLQTIGILVAEKTELQSTLQQTMKKIDKKQEEIDELGGRLKASRQKINDLEKYISQNTDSSFKNEQLAREHEETINDVEVQLNSSM